MVTFKFPQKAGEILVSLLIVCSTHLTPTPKILEILVITSLLEYHTAKMMVTGAQLQSE